MLLYLVRHGQSVGNEQMLFFGHTDYPLTALGREQARRAAEKLRGASFTRCVSSDLSRAWETAQICLDGRGIAPEADARLREQDMGRLEGLDWNGAVALCGENLPQILADWVTYTPPCGESTAAVGDRVMACFDAIATRGEDALIVAHNGSLSMLLQRLGLTSDPNRQGWNFTHGTYSVVEITDGAARLVAFNV